MRPATFDKMLSGCLSAVVNSFDLHNLNIQHFERLSNGNQGAIVRRNVYEVSSLIRNEEIPGVFLIRVDRMDCEDFSFEGLYPIVITTGRTRKIRGEHRHFSSDQICFNVHIF